jgi:predicted transcriptional regulator
MFHTYITHAQAKAYLSELIQVRLIEDDPFVSKYVTTSKGLEYLATLDTMNQMLSIETRRARLIQ